MSFRMVDIHGCLQCFVGRRDNGLAPARTNDGRPTERTSKAALPSESRGKSRIESVGRVTAPGESGSRRIAAMRSRSAA